MIQLLSILAALAVIIAFTYRKAIVIYHELFLEDELQPAKVKLNHPKKVKK